jgi:hypothetical protein
MELWLTEKVDRYFALLPAERAEYLDAEIDKLAGLQTLSAADEEPRSEADIASITALFGRAQRMIENAPPEQRQRFQEFQVAVQNRLIARQFKKAISGFE